VTMSKGEPPFRGHTNIETIRAILDWPLEFKGAAWDIVSEDARDCIRWMLDRDPSKRPEARDVLEHKYASPQFRASLKELPAGG